VDREGALMKKLMALPLAGLFLSAWCVSALGQGWAIHHPQFGEHHYSFANILAGGTASPKSAVLIKLVDYGTEEPVTAASWTTHTGVKTDWMYSFDAPTGEWSPSQSWNVELFQYGPLPQRKQGRPYRVVPR
jgi:hypothetical protein